MMSGFALYPFLPGLAAHRAGREIGEPALVARHVSLVLVCYMIEGLQNLPNHMNDLLFIIYKKDTFRAYWNRFSGKVLSAPVLIRAFITAQIGRPTTFVYEPEIDSTIKEPTPCMA